MEGFAKNKQFTCLLLFGSEGSGKKSTIKSLARKYNFDRQLVIDSSILDQNNQINRKIAEDLGLFDEEIDDDQFQSQCALLFKKHFKD
jgi:predicted AAA+ superfamily ATPase